MFVYKDEYVYKENELADEMYFIVKGSVSLMYGWPEKQLKRLQRGEEFGDVEIIKRISRKFSVKAARDCELLIMTM